LAIARLGNADVAGCGRGFARMLARDRRRCRRREGSEHGQAGGARLTFGLQTQRREGVTEPTNFDAGRGFFRGNRRDTQLSCPCCSAHWQRFVAAAGSGATEDAARCGWESSARRGDGCSSPVVVDGGCVIMMRVGSERTCAFDQVWACIGSVPRWRRHKARAPMLESTHRYIDLGPSRMSIYLRLCLRS
jgi:hypothetical protein